MEVKGGWWVGGSGVKEKKERYNLGMILINQALESHE